ncbi:tape measure protein [Arsukibacterium sp.]|uniref:tape measure protein n=1 Tax=Arsukibacterium sp. TaxID=1977258 RepID=UPI00299E0DCD|nr:tape measure protein [Arsukibacterium sp.]MDX1536400.1 tape measure protein [Arsukibacterium sp.]
MSKNLELALKIAATVTGDKDLARMADSVRDVGKGAAEADPKTDELAKSLKKLSNQQSLIRQFEQSSNALDANSMAAYAAATQLDKLRSEAQDSGKPFVELAKNIDVAEQQLEEMRQELASQAANHDRLQRELKETGLDTRKLSDEKRRVQNEFKRASTDVKKLGNDYLRANGQQRNFTQGAKDLTTRLVAVAGTYFGINRLWQTLTSLFSTGSNIEKLGVQFTALMGSIAGGEKATEWVRQFTKNTPLQLEEVSRLFVRLKAFGLDPMNGTLQAITDQAFKLGGGFQEAEGISLALGQAWAKQKLQGEEILQLIERGVPVWDLLAQVTGKNTQQLQKLSEQGKLGRDVIRDLMEEIGRQAKGSAAANMTLLSGLISNAKDNLAQFYNLVSSSGSMDWLKDQLTELNAQFEEMAADGRLQEWAQNVSDAIVSAGTFVRDTAGALYEFREEIGFVAKAWLALKVGSFLGNVVDGAKLAIIQLRTLTGVTAATSGEMSKLALTAKNVFRAIGIGLLVEGVIWAVGKLVDLKNAIFDLQAAQNALDESQRNLATTQRQLADEYTSVSRAVGMQITSIDQLLEAERAGLVVYDEKLKAYRAVKDAAQALAEAEREQIGQLRLTGTEAAAAAERILSMAGAHEWAGDTASGLNRQITAVLEVLRVSDGEYSNQINQLQLLADKNKQVGDVYEQKQVLLKNTAEAYKALGITSAKALEETAAKAQAAFEIITEANEPLEIQRQAFLKWADAALAAAKATGDTVPQQIRAQAAALGLTSALDDLASKQGISFELSDKQSQSFNALKQAFDKTRLSIEFYKQTIESSTASIEEKRLATLRLLEAEQLLQGQAEALLQVEQLKTKTFFEAQLALEDAKLKAEQITQAYMAGTLSTEQYNQQLQRQIMLIQILQGLVPDVKDDTEQHGDTQQNTGQQVDRTNQSIKEQSSALQSLSEDTDTATKYTSLYAGAQEWLRKQFDFSSSSSQDLAKRYDELTGFINQNRRAHNEWWRELARSSNAAFTREQQFISETLKVREYTAQLESSAATMQDVNRISMLLSSQFQQLGDNELAPLRNAITDAERRILSMRDSLEGTVNSLRDELDRLNNDQAAIEQRQYQQQLAELQAKLKEAQATGDKQAVATAQEALRLAKEIYAIKTAQFKEEQATQAATGNGQQQSSSPTGRTAARQQVPAPVPATTGTSATSGVRTVRLEVALPGKTYQATMEGNEAASLMRHLEREASTSL